MSDVEPEYVFDLMERLLKKAYESVNDTKGLSNDDRIWRCAELLRAKDNLDAARVAHTEGRIGAALWLYGGVADMLARHALPENAEQLAHGAQNRISALVVANQRRQIHGLREFVLNEIEERLAANDGNVSRTAKNLTAEWNKSSSEQCSVHTVRSYINDYLRRKN